MIKKIIKEISIRFRGSRNGWTQLHHLKSVDIIVDVGVASGTPDLYKIFQNAFFILVDPLNETEFLLKHKPNNYIFYNYALGISNQQINLNVPNKKSRSSILNRVNTLESYEIRRVNMISGYEFIKLAKINREMKVGIKIDTEGSELGVLKGFGEHLKYFSWIIIECSINNRFEKQSDFQDINNYIIEMGFSLKYVLNASSDSYGNIPYIDVAYENNMI